MKLRLILALICLLLVVQTVSAGENRVTNGDFETGDFTGWTVEGGGDEWSATVGTSYAYSGSYGCKLHAKAPAGAPFTYAQIKQDVDLTDVDELEFYYKIPNLVDNARFKVYIDSNCVLNIGSTSDWKYCSVDVSEYEGTHVVKFMAGVQPDPMVGGTIDVYLDDIVAESIEYYNVTFNFKDYNTQQLLNDVYMNYSVYYSNNDTEIYYQQTVDSGFTLSVPSNSQITVYEAEKDGYQSELEIEDYCLWILADADKSVSIDFYKNQTATHTIKFNFINAETDNLLDNVHLILSGDYEFDGVVYSGFTITLDDGDVVAVEAYKDYYQSEMEKFQYTKYVIADSDKTVSIYFYPLILQNETKTNVTFWFIDTKTGALLENVNFSISGAYSDSGIYDYKKTYQLDRFESYSWQASKSGYYITSGSFYLVEQNFKAVNVYLNPIGSTDANNTTVTFQVLDEQGNHIQSAAVTLNGQTKLTSFYGYAEFTVAKNNTYDYIVQKSGYYSQSGFVEVGTDPVLEKVVLYAISTPTPTSVSGGSGSGLFNFYNPQQKQQAESDVLEVFVANAKGIATLAVFATIMGLLELSLKPFRRLGRR